MEKVYYKAIDYVKIIAAILVVCVHTGPFLSMNEELNFFVVQVLARCAVPFFFLSSSFFLFSKIDRNEGLNTEKNLRHLKNYVVHLGRMYLFWTCIYLSIQMVIWIVNGFTLKSLLVYVRNFFFTGSYYHLWFLPALLFAVVFVYYLLLKKDAKEVIKYTFVFYIMGMFINVYEKVLLSIPLLKTIVSLYLMVFETARNGFFFGCIYVMMGYMLANTKINKDPKVYYPKLGCYFVLLVAEVYMIRFIGCMNDKTCMYFFLIPFIYTLFQLLLCFKSSEKGTILLRNSSTLLYVIHCYFTFVLQYVPIVNAHSFLYFLATLVLSFAFIIGYLQLAKKWPVLRKVI